MNGKKRSEGRKHQSCCDFRWNIERILICVLACTLILLPLTACDSSSPSDPGGEISGGVVSHSDCKSISMGGTDATTYEECAVWDYDGTGTLSMIHVNAEHNCCPGEIVADITIDGQTINILEYETEASCTCLCLYDVEYELTGLSPGTYQIIINSGGLYFDHILDFSVDLATRPQGEYCVER